MRRIVALSLLIGFLMFSLSCASWNKTKKGAAVGAGSGAV